MVEKKNQSLLGKSFGGMQLVIDIWHTVFNRIIQDSTVKYIQIQQDIQDSTVKSDQSNLALFRESS